MKLITPDTISFRAVVTEEELRERMISEVLEGIGGLGADGKPARGISATVKRGSGRAGGYEILISGPAPARIMLPASRGED